MKDFKDLTLRGQKMRIVRDAIAQIGTRVVVPRKGTYMNVFGYSSYHYKADTDGKESLQKILRQGKEDTCVACAKGSLFASCVLNTNRVYTNVDDFSEEYFQKKKLKKWFSVLELDMIEAAFEKKVVVDDEQLLYIYKKDGSTRERKTQLGKDCIAFGRQYRTEKARLLAILENILKHGRFKP